MDYSTKNNMPTDLSQLPPPPKGQTGVPLTALTQLPPPPTGQVGLKLSDIPVPTPSKNTPGFLSRLGTDFSNRAQSVTASDQAYQADPSIKNLAQSGFNIAGQFAGGALDVVKQGIQSIIPKAAENGLTKLSNKIADKITENPHILGGLQAINQGIDHYNSWAQTHPEDAKSLESVVNIGSLFAGAKGDMNLSDVADSAKTTAGQAKDLFSSIVEKQKNKSALSAEEANFKSALDRATPDYESATPTQKANLQGQTVNGKPRIQEGGIFSGRKVIPNSIEHQAGEELSKVPGYDSSLTHLETHQLIQKEISKEAQALSSSLDSEQIIAPKKQIMSVIRSGAQQGAGDSLLLQDTDPVVEKYLSLAQKAVDKNPGSLKGILDVRKTLDQAYESARGKLAFGDSRLNALDEVHQSSRNALNQFLQDNAQSTDVRASLKKQSNLYRADDVINSKAAKEGGSAIKRFAKNNPKTASVVKNALKIGIGGEAVKHMLP
jgi:hypothetical protein